MLDQYRYRDYTLANLERGYHCLNLKAKREHTYQEYTSKYNGSYHDGEEDAGVLYSSRIKKSAEFRKQKKATHYQVSRLPNLIIANRGKVIRVRRMGKPSPHQLKLIDRRPCTRNAEETVELQLVPYLTLIIAKKTALITEEDSKNVGITQTLSMVIPSTIARTILEWS